MAGVVASLTCAQPLHPAVAQSKEKEVEMAKRRRRVAELYLRGKSQRMIAEDVGFSVATVNRDLNYIQDRWKESALVDMDRAMARQLARLQQIEDELWEAWHKSKEDRETTKRKRKQVVAQGQDGEIQVEADTPTEVQMQRKTKASYGDTQIMNQIMKVVDRRTRLLGLDEYDPTTDADRIDPLVEAIEETAEQMDPSQFEDEDIR